MEKVFKFSEETRRKMSEAKRGAKCYNWNHDVCTEKLVKMHKEGMSFAEIGRKVGMLRAGVRKRILKYGQGKI